MSTIHDSRVGAILAQGSEIHITGSTTFAYNSARRDGGAIKATDTRLTIGTIPQGGGLSSTSDLARGVTSSAQAIEMIAIGTASFIKNTAFDFGGAISFANPVEMNISDVTFHSNEAESGGAISLTSTAWATADIQRCRFERNMGTGGGALYLNFGGQSFLRHSSFWLNVAEESGGALFNTGLLDIEDTVFAENTATDGGLAIQNLESTGTVVLQNVTFEGNILSCPSQTFSYSHDTSPDSCRFELACAQCLDGCERDPGNVKIDRNTLPTCDPIPVGVWPSLNSTTLQTFDLKEGYYRVSINSPIVLECYQRDACLGGIDPSVYCAVGYSGPYCAVCAENYAPGSSRRCHECSGYNTGFAVVFATTALIISLFVAMLAVSSLVQLVGDGADEAQNQPQCWWQGKMSRFRTFLVKSMPLSAIRIVVVVLQIVIQFTEIAGAVYPDEYESFLSGMVLVNFDFGSILSSSCLFTTDFYDRLVLATVAPMVLTLACAVTFFIAKFRNRNVLSAGPIVKHRHLSVVLFMVFFVYSSVSFTIFQTFVCDSLDDGKAYLRADYSIVCNTARHKAYRLYASLMVCVYPVGIPAFFAFWLARHQRELETPGRETMPNLKSYRCIWSAYKPSCYYYEVVECGRRIALTGAAVFVLPDTAEQVAIVLLLAIVFVFISESISPFDSETDMWVYRWGNGIILASMYVALLLKVDLAEEGSQSSGAITVLLIAANVFMVLTVAVQSFLLMRELCASQVKEETAPRRDFTQQREEQDAFGIELEASMNA